jgi:hypothetical protein
MLFRRGFSRGRFFAVGWFFTWMKVFIRGEWLFAGRRAFFGGAVWPRIYGHIACCHAAQHC